MLTRRQALVRVAATGAAVLVRGATDAFTAPLQQPVYRAPQPTTAVNFAVPSGACDTHVHLVGDPQRYPFAGGASREPASVEELRAFHRALHIDRVILVQSSSYGTDNRCLLDGLKELGSRARGVVAIDDTIPDSQLDAWDRVGIRGVRLSGGQGITASADDRKRLQGLSRRLAGRKWHINTAVQFTALDGLSELFAASSVPVVLDHFARTQVALGVAQPGFDVLLKLMRTGSVYVKLSAEYSVSKDAPDYRDCAPVAKALIEANPQRILWATDWPHVGGTKGFDDAHMLNQFALWVPDAGLRKTILVDNPARLYGL